MSITSKHPEFAAKLRSARRRCGKSQEQIAAEVGTSRRHWIRWENGDHIPSPEFLERIGEAVGQPEEFKPEPPDDGEPRSVAFDPDDILEALSYALSYLHERKGVRA